MAPNKRKILEAARKYAQKGAKDRALKEYEKLLKLDPRDAKLRLEIGDAHRRWGQVAEATAAYSKVADQYMQEGFDARAVAVYKQIQNLDAENFDSYVPLANLYQRMGLASEAIQALQTAADGYHKQGKKREALELLRQMASLDPSNTTSRIKVADLLRHENMNDEAIAEYEAALEELDKQGEVEPAGTVLERILEIEPKRIPTLVALARNLLGRGLAERAEPFAKRALELEDDESGHYELLADVYRAQSRDAEMASTYRKLADLYRQRGDDDRARDIIQRFAPPESLAAPLEADTSEEMLLDHEHEPVLLEEDNFGNDALLTDEIDLDQPVALGDAAGEPLLDLDDEGLGGAPELDDTAVETPTAPEPELQKPEPPPEGDPDQLLAEASVYLRYGKRTQAIRNLEAILAVEPGHRSALEKLGDAHADGGDSAAAVDAWRRAAEGARDDGDRDTLAVLRDRIAALDPAAAEGLVPEAAAPPAPEPVDELPELDEDTGADAVDIGDEIEIEIDDEPLEEAAAAAPDTAVELDEGGTSLQEAARESSLSLGAGASASMSQQVQEDLEEAEFYRQQGLYDEAEGIYQRVLETSPNHPLALVRLGEIAAARGEEPGSSASGSQPPADEASAPDVEMGQDLADWTDDGLDDTDLGLDEGAGQEAASADLPDVDVEVELPDDDSEDDELEDGELELPDVDLGVDEAPVSAVAAGDTPVEPVAVDVPADEAPEQLADDASVESFEDLMLEASEEEKPEPDGDSFDLAAAVSEALDDDASASGSTGSLSSMNEQDIFSAVFSEFKKGVSKTLGEGDHEAHYDLGIAYREMGLHDDAMGEFETASAAPARRVDSLHMMGLCALDLGRADQAVRHLESALVSPDVSAGQTLAVRFELGRAFEALGELDQAREAWEAVAAADPTFCDVEDRLATLGEEKPEADAGGELESFDDLFADDDDGGEDPDDATGPIEAVSAEVSHESFSDLIAEANAPEDDLDDETGELPVAEVATPEPAPAAEPAPEPKQKRRKKKISFV